MPAEIRLRLAGERAALSVAAKSGRGTNVSVSRIREAIDSARAEAASGDLSLEAAREEEIKRLRQEIKTLTKSIDERIDDAYAKGDISKEEYEQHKEEKEKIATESDPNKVDDLHVEYAKNSKTRLRTCSKSFEH